MSISSSVKERLININTEKERDTPGTAGSFERDWTQGNITWNLLSLAWPLIISNTINMIGPTIDMIWVGRLGEVSVAGVGVAGMVVTVVNSLIMGLFVGLQAMIARFVGGKENETAIHTARQGFVFSIAFSIIVAIIGIFFAEPILDVFGVEAHVVAEGATYMRIQFIGIVTMSLLMMTESIMVASGDSITPMKISILYRLLHLALCPFLVLGWWLFPRMGTSGAALTSVVSTGVGAFLGMWILFSGRTRLRLSWENFRFDLNIIWRMVKIGIPASVTSIGRSFGHTILIKCVAPFGTMAVAAHSVGLRVDTVFFVPLVSMAMAAGVLAGQNLGMCQAGRSEKTAWQAVILCSGFMLVVSAVAWFRAEIIAGIFTSRSELIELLSLYFRIQIVAYMVFGIVIVLPRVLSVVGDTLTVMVFNIIDMWGIMVPMAYLLSRIDELGVSGVWWGMVISVVARSVAFSIYFRLGKWRLKRV